MIGDIDDGQRLAIGQGLRNRVPLVGRVVDAGRVVAASVQQHRIARSRAADRGQHSVAVGHPFGRRVIEGYRFQAQIVKDLLVIGPARRAHVNAFCPRLGRQGSRQPNGARAPRGLHALDAAAHGGILAEYPRHQPIDEAHVPFGTEIGLAVLKFVQDVLGILDRSEDRGFAGIGAIDPYAQIDLVGAIVGVVELDQRE